MEINDIFIQMNYSIKRFDYRVKTINKAFSVIFTALMIMLITAAIVCISLDFTKYHFIVVTLACLWITSIVVWRYKVLKVDKLDTVSTIDNIELYKVRKDKAEGNKSILNIELPIIKTKVTGLVQEVENNLNSDYWLAIYNHKVDEKFCILYDFDSVKYSDNKEILSN